MESDLETVLKGLNDAGCGRDMQEQAAMIYQRRDKKELIHYLRCCRSRLMDQLHESQKRVDCLDFLIRRTEKAEI